MSTATTHRLTRQDYDEMFEAWTEPDLREAVRRMYEAVEHIVGRHVEKALEDAR